MAMKKALAVTVDTHRQESVRYSTKRLVIDQVNEKL